MNFDNNEKSHFCPHPPMKKYGYKWNLFLIAFYNRNHSQFLKNMIFRKNVWVY